MSKPKLVVLGFLTKAPMYGYQIGQIVEELGFPAWAEIRLPSIYKALQDLEASEHITSEQVVSGNNPPRKVFSLTPKGEMLRREFVRDYLVSEQTMSKDWWLTLSFADKAMGKEEMLKIVQNRLEILTERGTRMQHERCNRLLLSGEMPSVHKHLMRMGQGHHDLELRTLEELQTAILAGEHDDFFIVQGDIN